MLYCRICQWPAFGQQVPNVIVDMFNSYCWICFKHFLETMQMQINFVFTKSLFYIRLFNFRHTSNWSISLYIWEFTISDNWSMHYPYVWFLQAWYYIGYVSLTYIKTINIHYTIVFFLPWLTKTKRYLTIFPF